MGVPRVTVKTLPDVLVRFVAWVSSQGRYKEFADSFNAYLDQLASEDAFGTEGQCDPRGDGRDY